MKKFIFTLVCFFTFFLPLQSFGFYFQSKDNLNFNKELKDDVYLFWWNISVDQNINWDLIVAWGNIRINSDIEWDLMCAGGSIIVNWKVKWDIRTAGGDIKIMKDVKEDLLVAWGNVKIYPKATISWDLWFSAWNLTIDWKIKGKLKWNVWRVNINNTIESNVDLEISEKNTITIWKNANIKWNLNYSAKSQIASLEKITTWKIQYSKRNKKGKSKSIFKKVFFNSIILNILFLTIFGFLSIFFARKFFSWVWENLKQKTGKSFLIWFLFYATMPFLLLILFISLIWSIFWILFLIIYIFTFIFVNLINVVWYSSLIVQKMWGYKECSTPKLLWIVFIFSILTALIPFIDIIAAFWPMWAILLKKHEIFKKEIV